MHYEITTRWNGREYKAQCVSCDLGKFYVSSTQSAEIARDRIIEKVRKKLSILCCIKNLIPIILLTENESPNIFVTLFELKEAA